MSQPTALDKYMRFIVIVLCVFVDKALSNKTPDDGSIFVPHMFRKMHGKGRNTQNTGATKLAKTKDRNTDNA